MFEPISLLLLPTLARGGPPPHIDLRQAILRAAGADSGFTFRTPCLQPPSTTANAVDPGYLIYVRYVAEIPEAGIMDAWLTIGPDCRRASWLYFLNSIDDNKRESLPERLRT